MHSAELAMITECWTPQINHRDTFFSIYLLVTMLYYKCTLYTSQRSNETSTCKY